MKFHAVVMHNVSRDMFWGYKPETSVLHHAHTFQVEADNIEKAADLVWVLTNVDNADHLRMSHPHLSQYADQVTQYRERLNRSLSVADVIVFFERERYAGALAVAVVGHDAIDFDPTTIRTVTNDRDESDAYAAHQRFADQHR